MTFHEQIKSARARPYNPEPFVQRIKELLKKRGESARHAAIQAGLTPRAVQYFIQQGRRPNMVSCLLLADHFDVNPNELLELAGWPTLRIFDIRDARAMNLPPEVVDVAVRLGRIQNIAHRKRLAKALQEIVETFVEQETQT